MLCRAVMLSNIKNLSRPRLSLKGNLQTIFTIIRLCWSLCWLLTLKWRRAREVQSFYSISWAKSEDSTRPSSCSSASLPLSSAQDFSRQTLPSHITWRSWVEKNTMSKKGRRKVPKARFTTKCSRESNTETFKSFWTTSWWHFWTPAAASPHAPRGCLAAKD